MRRSLGGRNMGGGGMIRSVLRAGVPPEPLSCSATINAAANSRTAQNFNDKTTTALTLSSFGANGTSAAFSSLINFPISSSDESEWECVDGIEEEGRAVVFYEDYNDVFATVPSTDEVHHAVSALKQAFGGSDEVAKVSSEMDWIEPSPRLCNSKMLQLHGPDTSVYNAFHLLETEPCVQRMVISLSSDKAVWDAVLDNEVVKELRRSICEQAAECSDKGCGDSNPMKDILSWIVANGKAKIMQVMDSIKKLVYEAFQGHKDVGGDCADPFQEKLTTSLLLSVMVLLVVVITRTTKTTL
ncbi:hypothetical protein ACS0TY_010988 [Phlomoides rotata]